MKANYDASAGILFDFLHLDNAPRKAQSWSNVGKHLQDMISARTTECNIRISEIHDHHHHCYYQLLLLSLLSSYSLSLSSIFLSCIAIIVITSYCSADE